MNNTYEAIQAEITALKSLLIDTDYNSNKLVESLVAAMDGVTAVNFIPTFLSWLSDTVNEYGAVVRDRASWRTKINELEDQLAEDEINEDAESDIGAEEAGSFAIKVDG